MENYKIAVIIGSLRKESFNRKTANALIGLAPDNLTFNILDIGNLPLYNEDLESKEPSEWVTFRQELQAHDAILFFTPEYNRSVPAALKNALDVGSRPYGGSSWDKKPAGIISVSPGAYGAFGANHHLRQSLVFLNVPTMAQPEAYIGSASKLFDVEGTLTDERTIALLNKFLAAYADWVKACVAR